MSVTSSLIFTVYPTTEEYPADGEHPANREYPIRSEILIESIPLIVGSKVTWYVERVIVIVYHALHRVPRSSSVRLQSTILPFFF